MINIALFLSRSNTLYNMAQQQQQQVNIADLDMNSLQQVKGQLEEVQSILMMVKRVLTLNRN